MDSDKEFTAMLFTAIDCGHTVIVRRMLKFIQSQPEISKLTWLLPVALQHTIRKENQRIFWLLIDHGADVDTVVEHFYRDASSDICETALELAVKIEAKWAFDVLIDACSLMDSEAHKAMYVAISSTSSYFSGRLAACRPGCIWSSAESSLRLLRYAMRAYFAAHCA